MSAHAASTGDTFSPSPRHIDTARRLTVSLSLVACSVGSMIGVGVFGGTPIDQAAGGALDSSATLLAPAGPAFNIWTVIYAGLAAYAAWQWLPPARHKLRQRSLGWLVAASMLLNAGWILSIQAGWLNFSVLVIVVLMAVLAALFVRCVRRPPGGRIDAVIVDGTLGLYLGWVCVAVCANIAAALTVAGFTGELESTTTAVAAVVAATIVVVATVVVRLSGAHSRAGANNSESAG